jgi:hypothetical protein
MAEDTMQLPPGYEDAKPVKSQQEQMQLPPGYEDAKPVVSAVPPTVAAKSTKPQEPGMLDVANKAYEGPGVMNALGRLGVAIPNMARGIYHAAVDAPKDLTEQAVATSPQGPLAGRAALAAKRLLVDPSNQTAQHLSQRADELEARGEHQSPASRYFEAGTASLPVIGPIAYNLAERAAGTGPGEGTAAGNLVEQPNADPYGAMTEATGYIAAPEIAKEAMPGGKLPGAPAAGARPFPTVDAAVRTASRVADKAVPAAPYVAGAMAGHPYVGARLLSGITDPLSDIVEKGKVYGLSAVDATAQQLGERAAKSAKVAAKTQAEVDKYNASKENYGVEAPEDVLKANEKAQLKAREDALHAHAAKEAADKVRTEGTAKPASQPEVPTEQIEAMPRPGAPKPAATPENVKTPGQIRPERIAAEEPLQEKPQVPVGQRQLPNAQGTVGTQKLLTRPELPVEAPAAGTEPTPDWKTKEPAAAEVKSEYPEFPMVRPGEAPAAPKAGMPQMRLPEEAPKSGIPQMTDEAALRALEAKEGKVVTNPKKLVGEQLKEALKPGEAPKANEPAAPKANEPAAPKAKEEPKVEEKKEPVMTRTEEGREQPKSAAEYHPAVQQKVSELSDENLRKLAKAHGLNPDEYDFKARDEGRHRVERDQLAKDITAQMGDDEKINLGRAAEQTEKQGLFQGADTSAKGRASRAEKMFPRLRGPVDEYGNPKISGGAPEAGEYKGEERRETPRKAPLNAKETEEAMKNRKSFTNPFDETEGAAKTIAGDKNMPKHPAEEKVGTEAAAKSDTEHFANAKKELGDKASISDVAKRAQELKDATAQLEVHEKNGGSTFSSKGKDLNGTDKYSVGAYPDRTEQVDKLTPERLDEFKKKNADVLSKEDHAVGTWKDPDTGKAVLDVARIYADRDEAIAAGKAANQKSIYHLGGEGEIKTGGTGEGPAKGEAFPDKIERPTTTTPKGGSDLPTRDALVKKYGETKTNDPKGITFILDDGTKIPNTGVDHNQMVGGKTNTVKNSSLERFMDEGNIRVRESQGTAGRMVAISIPKSGVNAIQWEAIKAMGPQLRSGGVAFEIGNLGGKYETIGYGEATDERMQQAINNITGKGEAPKSLGSAAAGTAFGKEAPLTPKQLQERLPDLAQQHLSEDEKTGLSKLGEKKKKSPYGNMR